MKVARPENLKNEKAFSFVGILIVVLILGFLAVKGMNMYLGDVSTNGSSTDSPSDEEYMQGETKPITNHKQQQSVIDNTMQRINAAQEMEQQRAKDIMNGFDEKNYR